MSKDKKNSNIFSHQIEAIVCIILQIFFVKRAVLKIGAHLTDSRPIYHRPINHLQIFLVKRAVLKIGAHVTDSRPIYHRQSTDIPPMVNS